MKTVDWNWYARVYDTLVYLTPYQDMLETVCAALPMPAVPLLDAGCGTGNFLAHMQRRCSSSEQAELYGTDSAPHQLARARTKLSNAVQLTEHDLNTRLPHIDDRFRVVTCINTLYALPHPEQLLRECARVLRRGGLLVLVTPKKDHDNGLILKQHCGSSKPDSYWRNMYSSPEREEALLREAFAGDNVDIQDIMDIAAINREISQNVSKVMQFFEKDELCEMVRNAGFTRIHHDYTYTKQAHLITATSL